MLYNKKTLASLVEQKKVVITDEARTQLTQNFYNLVAVLKQTGVFEPLIAKSIETRLSEKRLFIFQSLSSIFMNPEEKKLLDETIPQVIVWQAEFLKFQKYAEALNKKNTETFTAASQQAETKNQSL